MYIIMNSDESRRRKAKARRRRARSNSAQRDPLSNHYHRMARQPCFKSEVFVPIQKDSKSFEERQHGLWTERNIWADMEERMERRRRDWENEVERMRKDFFKLKPSENRRGSSENLLESRGLHELFYDDTGGDKKFQVSFDVSQFKPEEIDVRTQDDKLIVHAKHEEKGQSKSLSREYSRQVDIPKHVNPENLNCTLSNDGVLQVEASVSAPAYSKIQDSIKRFYTPETKSGQLVTEHDGSKNFRISIDIGRDFLPQDVVVKTIDAKLVINARHEEQGKGRSSVKEFSREFDLPENVDPNLVTASMTDEGALIVEAPISNYKEGSYTAKSGSTKQPKITISFGK